MYALLDKRSKIPQDTFENLLAQRVPNKEAANKISKFMELEHVSDVERMFGRDELVGEAFNELAMVYRTLLEDMKVGEYCKFDPSIVRGLAYYTGVVFEVHAEGGELRAICGGGRYDNLLSDLGGPPISATGMGMGDCVLEILLRENGRVEDSVPDQELDYFVALVPEMDLNHQGSSDMLVPEDELLRLVTKLRKGGCSADYSYKSVGLGKQLKQASDRNAKKCIIIGEEYKDNKLVVKDMKKGDQELVDKDEFLSRFDSGNWSVSIQ